MPVRFSTFPRTKAPPPFVAEAVSIFSSKIGEISTVLLAKGLTSDEVLSVLRCELEHVGFDVETGKRADQKIKRPVFFGENAQPDLQYEVDAWHPEWKAGMEVEAGRAWMRSLQGPNSSIGNGGHGIPLLGRSPNLQIQVRRSRNYKQGLRKYTSGGGSALRSLSHPNAI